MANLSIRKLDPLIYKALCMRAAKHGVSMEEEVRQIICQTVTAPDSIGEVFCKYFGDQNGVDLESVMLHKPHEPMDFNE